MYFAIFVVASAAAAAVYLNRDRIKKLLLTARYEAIYWLLGGAAMVDDLLYSRSNKLKELPKKSNQIAIVTGGSRGIGLEIVRKLLMCDMTVVIACRKVQAGQEAIKKLKKEGVTTGNAFVQELDVASMKSVKKFAEDFLAKYNQCHLLINNAGIMFVPHSLTEDGFESQLSVNYLGHFLLAHLLFPTLIETGRQSISNVRIVNVSSCAHIPGDINFEDINYEKNLYIPSQAYAQSKLAQLMFTKAIERRCRAEGYKISSFAVHPGVVDTELFDGTTLKTLAPWMPKLFFKTPEQGATSVVFAGISDTLDKKGGAYLSNCREMWVSSLAKDINQQERLMFKSMEMLNVREFGRPENAKKVVNNNFNS